MLTVLCLSRCRPAGPQWLPNTSVCPSHWGLWNQSLQATPELLVQGPGAAGGVRVTWARGSGVAAPRLAFGATARRDWFQLLALTPPR